MSRNYTQVTTAIWLDADFRALSPDAQWTYLMLISQSDITSIGSLSITLKRWAAYAKGMTIKRLSGSITELEDRNFVVVDPTVEELLVRSFVRWDGGYKIPKRLDSIKATALRLNSKVLQQVAAYELDQLGIVHGIPTEPIESLSNGYPEDIDSPGVVVTTVVSPSNPQPTTSNPVPGGCRIAPDWQPNPRLIEFVKAECPSVNGRVETDNFRDWWIAKPGKDALKTDWDATYRNWMRKAQKEADERRPRNGTTNGHRRSTTDDAVNQTLEMARRYAEEDAAAAANQPTRLGIAR